MRTFRMVWTYFVIALVALAAALDYELFVFPNAFAPSGINGICTMIQYISGISVGYMSLLINVPLALIVYFKVSKPMAVRSMVYVVVFSLGLLILDKGEALDVDALKADVISKLALDDGTATTISQVYDVNKSSRMDINDAQLVYDIYNGTYFDFTKVSMEKFLLADVNCDKMVNSADAVVIVGQFR